MHNWTLVAAKERGEVVVSPWFCLETLGANYIDTLFSGKLHLQT